MRTLRQRIDGTRYSCTHERREPEKVNETRNTHYMGDYDLEDSHERKRVSCSAWSNAAEVV